MHAANGSGKLSQGDAHVCEYCIKTLQQVIYLTESLASDNDIDGIALLRWPSKSFPQSTLSRHLRHVQERYSMVLECIFNGKNLDYEARGSTRQGRLEFDNLKAIRSFFEKLEENVKELDENALNTPLALANKDLVFLHSTGARELYDAACHAVHHFAVIASLLREHLGQDATRHFPPSFGFRP